MSAPSSIARGALALMVPLCVFGIGVGVYMSWHHELAVYGPGFGEISGCAEAEGVSCDVVNTSEWSELFGVPQFTWAIPMYVTIAGLAAWAALKDHAAAWPVLALAVWGAVYSGFLAYISKVQLDTWCLWCIRLYVTNGALLLLAAIAARGAPWPDARPLGVAAALFGVSAVGAIGAQKGYRAPRLVDGPPIAAVDATAAPRRDPSGPAPVRSWTVRTEDGNDATLRTAPTDAWKGNPDARVAVVEFADFECGYCKRAAAELRRLEQTYGDRVLFVYKHFPMDPTCNPGVNNRKHARACQAAEGAVCAQEQGVFWAYHDLTFKNQHKLDPEDLIAYAERAGADPDAFRRCLTTSKTADGQSTRDRVVADGEHGKELDLHGTPRIWIEGRLYRAGQSAEVMARAIEIALGATAGDADVAAAAMRERGPTILPIPADVPEMRTVALGDRRFEIDTFEAALVAGAPKVGKREIPATRMSWYAARDACEAAGKRLCTEEEWFSACQGAPAVDDDGDGAFADDMIEGTTYPYGDYHEPSLCWDNKLGDGFRPVYTGEMPGCASAQGVYDLTGNVEEWVGATPESAALMGGAFDTKLDHARCTRKNTTFGPGYASLRTGFRCCR